MSFGVFYSLHNKKTSISQKRDIPMDSPPSPIESATTLNRIYRIEQTIKIFVVKIKKSC